MYFLSGLDTRFIRSDATWQMSDKSRPRIAPSRLGSADETGYGVDLIRFAPACRRDEPRRWPSVGLGSRRSLSLIACWRSGPRWAIQGEL